MNELPLQTKRLPSHIIRCIQKYRKDYGKNPETLDITAYTLEQLWRVALLQSKMTTFKSELEKRRFCGIPIEIIERVEVKECIICKKEIEVGETEHPRCREIYDEVMEGAPEGGWSEAELVKKMFDAGRDMLDESEPFKFGETICSMCWREIEEGKPHRVCDEIKRLSEIKDKE